jgi:hypothetical protein
VTRHLSVDFCVVINQTKAVSSSLLQQLPGRRATKVHVPSDLPAGDRRGLTLNLGGGNCLWQVRPNGTTSI